LLVAVVVVRDGVAPTVRLGTVVAVVVAPQ
jgi:hypothetical protein